MIFDTDVLIWMLRGNLKAAKTIDATEDRRVSVVTYMELIQGARDNRELIAIKSFLSELAFQILPLTENIGHRASIYMEEYSLLSSMGMADALIAGTSTEGNLPLLTGNDKHYKSIKELQLKRFRP